MRGHPDAGIERDWRGRRMATTEAKVPSPTIEVRSIDWVPEDERHGKVWQQGPFWFLGNFQFFTIALGFTGPLVGLSLWWSFVAGALGILFGTIFMALHATQGPRLGLPQMIQSRAQFGYRGAIVVLFGSLFTFMAFNVVDQLLIAAGVNGIFGWNSTAVAIAVTVIGALLAIFGHDWLHKVFRAILYVSVPVFLLVTIGIVTGNAGEVAAAPGLGFNFVGFMVMFTVAMGYNITYAPYVSDYTRYLPKNTPRGPIIASVFFGASGSPLWLIPLGAYLASRLGASDALVALRDAGDAFFKPLGTLAAIMSVAALVATMGINAYSAMLSVVTGIDCFKKVEPTARIRVVTIVVLAAVWCGAAFALSTDALTALSNSLILMLYLLVPWTAINLVDFFLVRHGAYSVIDIFKSDGIYGVWSPRGLVTYFVTIAAMLPFMVLLAPPDGTSPYTGFMATNLDGVDYSAIVGLLVASVLYFLLARSRDETNEAAAIQASDRELTALASAEAVGHEHGVPMEEAPVPERGMPDPEETPDEPLGGGGV
jgi:nucleobase:cation symporter-1, NCS1 family